MTALTLWTATAAIIAVGIGLYAVAPGAGVLVFFAGVVGLVVVGDRMEES